MKKEAIKKIEVYYYEDDEDKIETLDANSPIGWYKVTELLAKSFSSKNNRGGHPIVIPYGEKK